jgi:hypothetical protein
MNYRDPYESKKFFQSQWHQPFKRFRKTALPIIVSAFSVFIVMVGIFAFLPGLINDRGNGLLIILHTSLAVLTGVALAFLGHLISFRILSRFETIKIRNRTKR